MSVNDNQRAGIDGSSMSLQQPMQKDIGRHVYTANAGLLWCKSFKEFSSVSSPGAVFTPEKQLITVSVLKSQTNAAFRMSTASSTEK